MHERMKADPTDWLLQPQCPPVRYWALVGIVNRPTGGLEVCAAQATVPTYPPVAA